MINAEKYKKQLRNVNRDTAMFERWGFNKRKKTFTPCGCIFCKECAMNELKEKQEEKDYVGCNHARITWLLSEYVEPIIITELEYKILKFIADNTKYMYIARDKNGCLNAYTSEPKKLEDFKIWRSYSKFVSLDLFKNLFTFIKWENEEPYTVKDILKNCRVIDDNIVIHKIVDE